jgi:two-component system, cell cycle sensor histidine kinase and response regulator CckA
MINKFMSLPIRTHLIVLLLLLALPSLLLIIHSGLMQRNQAIDAAKKDCLQLVETIATEQQATIAGAEQLAVALALLPDIRSRNREAAAAVLSELVRKNPLYSNIVLGDKFGIIWASAIPFEGKLSMSDRKYYQDAVRTGKFSSGEYGVGKAAKKRMMSFGYPVKNTANKLVGIIGVALDIDHAQEIFEKIALPPGASFSILDHQGIIIIRNLKDEFSQKLVGRHDIKEDNFTKAKEGPDEGTFEVEGNDGKLRLVAYKRLSLPHESEPYFYIRSSIPLASITAKANAAMLKNIALLGVLSGVGLFLVWIIGKFVIVRPIGRLMEASEQLAAGVNIVNVSREVNRGELGKLARAFDSMAEELAQREAALRKSEEHWATTLASIGDAVIVTDTEGKITFMNAVAEKLTGWPLSDVMLESVTKVFHIINEHTRREVEDPVAKVLREGVVVGLANHTILIGKNSTEIPIDDSGAPVRDRNGDTTGVVLVFRDIAEAKRAEKEISHLASFPMLNPNPIAEVDLAGAIHFLNPAAEKLFPDLHRLGLAHPWLLGWKDIAPNIFKQQVEQTIREVNVGEDWYIQSLSFVKEIERIHIYGRRITRRKLAEEALKERTAILEERTRQLEDTVQELERFSYSVSHDLKAPLRAIDGFSRTLLKTYGDRLDEDATRRLNIIRENAQNMGRLIEDLLSFSRFGRTRIDLSVFDMEALAGSVWEDIRAANRNRTIEVAIENLLPGFGDPALIRQVLYNLLSNAVKFTKERSQAVIELSSCREKSEIVYSVKDNGIGFDMQYREKVFGVFERLHSDEYEGTGVGLAIVQRIIHRHGGRVWAEGKENEGATFYFTLPDK